LIIIFIDWISNWSPTVHSLLELQVRRLLMLKYYAQIRLTNITI